MPVDRAAAKAAGYTDQEIDAFEAQAPAAPAQNFDYDGAIAAGYTPQEIAAAGYAPQAQPQTPFRKFWNQVNPIAGLQGLTDIVRHPIQATSAYTENIGRGVVEGAKSLGRGEFAKGAEQILSAGSPLAEAGEDARKGRYLDAAGTTFGVGTNLAMTRLPEGIAAVKKGAAPKLQAAAEKLYQTKVKQPTGEYGQPVSPLEAQKRTRWNLKKEIEGTEAGEVRRAAIQDETVAKLRETYGGKKDATVSPEPVRARLAALKEQYQKKGRPSAVREVEAIEEEFFAQLRNEDGSLRNMTPEEAFDFKIGKQQEVTEARSGAYAPGGKNSPSIKARQDIAGSLGDQLVEQFPESRALNEDYSMALKNRKPLARAVQNSKNAHWFGLLDRLASGAGGALGAGVGAMFGGAKGAGAGSVIGAGASAFASKIANSPGIRTRLAIKLSKMAGEGAGGVKAAQAAIDAYIARQETPKIIKPERLAEIEYEKNRPKGSPTKPEGKTSRISDWLAKKIASKGKRTAAAAPVAGSTAPALNQPYDPDTGRLSRDARGRFVSDKTRMKEFAKQ